MNIEWNDEIKKLLEKSRNEKPLPESDPKIIDKRKIDGADNDSTRSDS